MKFKIGDIFIDIFYGNKNLIIGQISNIERNEIFYKILASNCFSSGSFTKNSGAYANSKVIPYKYAMKWKTLLQ